MGKPTGFKEFPRETVPYRDPVERVNDYEEIFTDFLGVRRVIWLDKGISGDDTHGHVAGHTLGETQTAQHTKPCRQSLFAIEPFGSR